MQVLPSSSLQSPSICRPAKPRSLLRCLVAYAQSSPVFEHLRHHLDQIPDHDKKTRAILSKMLQDEEEHGDKAMEQGGIEFNKKIKKFMTSTSKLMTKATYKV